MKSSCYAFSSSFEIRKRLLLDLKQFGGVPDIGQASFIVLGELLKLGTAQEELWIETTYE